MSSSTSSESHPDPEQPAELQPETETTAVWAGAPPEAASTAAVEAVEPPPQPDAEAATATAEPAAEPLEASPPPLAELPEASREIPGPVAEEPAAGAEPSPSPALESPPAAAAAEAGLLPPAALGDGSVAVYPVREERKRALLQVLLDRGLVGKAVVFTRTKHRANRLTEWLAKRGITVDRVHTQRSHRQRRDAMTGFCEGGVRVLVVAGRASRLLELKGTAAVVHLDVPESLADFRERLATVSWQGEGGGSFFFAGESDTPYLKAIEEGVAAELPRLTLDGFDYEAAVPAPGAEGGGEPVARIGERRPRPRSRGARRRRRAEPGSEREPGPAVRVPSSGGGFAGGEDEEEARIRALAEAQQAAAVAARLSPSRMGIMEWKNGRQAGGGRSSRRQAHRGHQPS